MVKMGKVCLVISIVLLFMSCACNTLGYSTKKYGDKENFVWDFAMLIKYYTGTYNKSPQSAKDLMIYIDRMDKDSRLLGEDYYIYDNQYLYLKNNQDKLIFVTDSLLSIYYKKKIKEKCLLVQTSIYSPCSFVDVFRVYFFDKDGLWIQSDSLSTKAVINRLYREYWNYGFKTKENNMVFEKTKFEYTPNTLKDLCSGKMLNINHSALIKNTYDYLDSLARTNKYSRIIASGFR